MISASLESFCIIVWSGFGCWLYWLVVGFGSFSARYSRSSTEKSAITSLNLGLSPYFLMVPSRSWLNSIKILLISGSWKAAASFGWDVISLDGHDIVALNDALSHRANNMKPKVIVAHTTKGKGVSFMENNNTWHHNRLTQTTFDQAIAELNL